MNINSKVTEPAEKKLCIIAARRIWNSEMLLCLEEETNYRFHLISKVVDLNYENLSKLQPTYIFFPHWSDRIEPKIFNNFECVIFHMTDLPYGRGGSPLQNLIKRGFETTKLSAIRCVEEMDGGPIYLKRELSLLGAAEEIFLRATDVIKKMIVEILRDRPAPVAQDGAVTLFKRRKPEDGNMNNELSLNSLFDMIRMVDAEGYPKAFFEIGPFKLEFSRASLKQDRLIADVHISLIKKISES